MASKSTAYIVYSIIASILGWGAFGLGISSVVSSNWVEAPSVNTRFGLWFTCMSDTCIRLSANSSIPSWLFATRAFMCLMVIFAFFGGLANAVAGGKMDKKSLQGSGGIWAIAGLFGTVGAAVFTGFQASAVGESTLSNFGYGFIVAWTCTGLLFIANILCHLAAKEMPDRSVSTQTA